MGWRKERRSGAHDRRKNAIGGFFHQDERVEKLVHPESPENNRALGRRAAERRRAQEEADKPIPSDAG